MYIYISTYTAPLQGPPSPGSAKEESLEEFIKRTGKVLWQKTKVRGKTIPNRETHNRESPFLSGGNASTWHHKVPLGGRAERSATRARQSQDKELQKIRRCVTKITMPDNGGDLIMDVLLNWEPVEYIPHVICDMAKHRHTTNHASSRPQNTV